MYKYHFNADEMTRALLEESIWISDGIFPKPFSEKLFEQALSRHHKGLTTAASIGLKQQQQRVEEIRGDHIAWIQDWKESDELETYQKFLEELRQSLCQSLLIALKRFEVHFSVYPEGTFYKKHLDQHRDSKHRQVSCVYYLSPWKEGNGGQLKVYPKDKAAFEIEPLEGRFVCFISGELPHEVLKTQAPRCALTGWYRDDSDYLT